MKINSNDESGAEGEDAKHLELSDTFKNEEPMPAPIPGPDGGPILTGYLSPAEPIPSATVENFLCLAGPCRYYIEIHSLADVETRGLSHQPKMINRMCKVMPGYQIDLTDDCVFKCSAWDPLSTNEIEDRESRRDAWRRRALASRKSTSNSKE